MESGRTIVVLGRRKRMSLHPPVPVDTKEAVSDDVFPYGTMAKEDESDLASVCDEEVGEAEERLAGIQTGAAIGDRNYAGGGGWEVEVCGAGSLFLLFYN
ncbi:hypothetical protein Ancab_023196 [Ancistrocladus abbreviatus]